MSTRPDPTARPKLQLLLIAGLIGGLSEVAWVALYSALTPLTAGEVSRGIVASVAPGLADLAWAPTLGLGIHLGLSMLLGLAFGLVVWRPVVRRHGARAAQALALVVLGAVWSFNFLLLLPWLNPKFVTLMPPLVTLTSKLLFALAMARSMVAARAWDRGP